MEKADYQNSPHDDIIEHILRTHHIFVKTKLTKIYNLLKKNSVSDDVHSEIDKILSIFEDLKYELEMHLIKEEKMLFPYISRMAECERNNQIIEPAPFGTVQNPITVMETEHKNALFAFAKIRKITNNYKGISGTNDVIYKELEAFEKDLNEHIHIENDVLHPKAIELEHKIKHKLFNN